MTVLQIYNAGGLERVMQQQLGVSRPVNRAQAHQNLVGSMGVYFTDKTQIEDGIAHYFHGDSGSRSRRG